MPAIIFAIDSLLGGGAEKVILTLAAGFAEKGYKSHLITFEPGCDHVLPDHLHLHVLDESHCKGSRTRRLVTLASWFDQKVEEITQQDGYVLGVISSLTFTDKVLHYSKFPRILFCIHSHLSNYWKVSEGNFIRRFKRLRKLKKLYARKHLVCVGYGIAEDVNRLGIQPSSIRTIYNPFDIEKIRDLPQAPLSTLLPAEYLLSVGRFKHVKRHDRLLRAYAKSNVSTKLVIMGKGSPEEEARLRRLVLEWDLKEKVIFLGFLPNPYPYIRHAKALLLSSDFEGLPTVIIEALICGTPVVSTDCPSGPREILTGDQSRFLVPVDDEDMFSQKICEVLQSPPELDEYSLARFRKDLIVSHYEDILLSLAKLPSKKQSSQQSILSS